MKTLMLQIGITTVLIFLILWWFRYSKIYSNAEFGTITYLNPQSFDFDMSNREVSVPIPDVSKFKYERCMKFDRYIQGLGATDMEKSWLHSVMFCESSCRETVLSPSGTYKGLFQFDNPTWKENCEGDIFDGYSQIDCTLKLYKKNQQWRWPNCGKLK
jgi:hypothetical protein